MLFFYVRHGDPIYNPDSLTPLGHEQAKALSKRFVSYGLDKIFSSPSVRAQQTAQPTCDLLGKEKTLCPWADEGLAWQDFAIDASTGIHTWCFYDPAVLEIFRSPEARSKRPHQTAAFASSCRDQVPPHTMFRRGDSRIAREFRLRTIWVKSADWLAIGG